MKKKAVAKPPTLPRKSRIERKVKQAAPKTYKLILIILLLTFLAYIPALSAGFVNWDDPDYVNRQILQQSLQNFTSLIITPVQGNYHPLTMLSLAFNYLISGMDPWSYHLLNLLLHMANCVLVFRFTLVLARGNALIAFVSAVLFGIHPMHVESVAWVSERKDVLYSLFFIAGLTSYTKFIDTAHRKQYVLTLVFFVLSLLSKPAAAIFPLVLFCIDLLRTRKLSAKLFVEKIPFFALALIAGIITYVAQKEKGALNAYAFSADTRLLMGFYGIMVYFIKMIVPIRLSPFYPYAPVNEPLPKEYYLAPVFFIALAVICVYSWKRNRVITFGILFFLVNLLLVLQFLPVGSAIIADRYTYIPYIGLFFIIGWVINQFAKKNKSRAYYIMIPTVILLFFLTYRQSAVWTNSGTLWDHAIAINPSSRAYVNRARLFVDEKLVDKALEYYNAALALNAIDKEAFTNRGNIYFNKGKIDLAYEDYKKVLSIDSNYYQVLDNLGALFGLKKQYDSALHSLTRALLIKPDYFPAYRNRSLIYLQLNRYNEAIGDMENFMKYNPDDPDAYNFLATCYRLQGKYEQSLNLVNKAISIKQDPHFYLNRAYSYGMLKNNEQARKDALVAKQAGLQLDPAFERRIGIQ